MENVRYSIISIMDKMTGKSYAPTEMIILGASPGSLPGLPAGEATPSR